jgi:hypothetical protein
MGVAALVTAAMTRGPGHSRWGTAAMGVSARVTAAMTDTQPGAVLGTGRVTTAMSARCHPARSGMRGAPAPARQAAAAVVGIHE